MNRLEKFGLATGIIGLCSDTVALTAFIGGLWGNATTAVTTPYKNLPNVSSVTTVREIPLVIATILILTIIYSWLVISWVLCRRSFLIRTQKKGEITSDTMQRSISGMAIVTWPLVAMWLVIILQTDSPTKIEANNLYATQQAILATTPEPVNGRAPDPFPTNGVWDKTDATYLGVFLSIPLQALLVVPLLFVLVNLMPVVYPDMLEYVEVEPIEIEDPITKPKPPTTTRR